MACLPQKFVVEINNPHYDDPVLRFYHLPFARFKAAKQGQGYEPIEMNDFSQRDHDEFLDPLTKGPGVLLDHHTG